MKIINLRAYLAWIATCIIWGTTYLAIRVGVESLPPMLFAGFRWIIAGPIFLIILLLRGYTLPSKHEYFPIVVVGLALLGVANGLVVVAEQWIPSGLTALLITTLPFWVVGLEIALFKNSVINPKVILGLTLGFLGITLIFASDLKYLLESTHFVGILCILGAVISWAAGSIYSKNKKLKTHPLVSAAFQMVFAGLAQIIVGLFLGELNLFSFNQDNFFAFVYLVFVGSMLGYGSYIYAIAHLPVSLVTTYAYINPIIALILGWLILNEKLDSSIIISALLVLIGVALVNIENLKITKRHSC